MPGIVNALFTAEVAEIVYDRVSGHVTVLGDRLQAACFRCSL
jgi:hypothetical protein